MINNNQIDWKSARVSDIPKGLNRSHTWYPHQSAIDAAVAVERFMDTDDYLDRYLMRIKDMDKKPSSSEFLTWYFDDDAASRRRERNEAKRNEPGVDDTGTPLSWRRH